MADGALQYVNVAPPDPPPGGASSSAQTPVLPWSAPAKDERMTSEGRTR